VRLVLDRIADDLLGALIVAVSPAPQFNLELREYDAAVALTKECARAARGCVGRKMATTSRADIPSLAGIEQDFNATIDGATSRRFVVGHGPRGTMPGDHHAFSTDAVCFEILRRQLGASL
jgi:hypothetical protein